MRETQEPACGETATPPCFVRGTRILTASGEMPVEDIVPGTILLTADGDQRRTTWVGRRRVELGHHPRAQDAWPIRVRRGALGNGVPARDLLLSPDHALLVNHVLIAARALVNGATVLPDPTWQCVEYVHIACDAHDVLVAEGAPAESLPPRGNLSAFAGGAVMLLHPGFAEAGPAGSDCAPRLNSGPAVREARQALLERARLLGHGITHDPDLHLLVDGVRIDPSGSAGALRRFLVPPEAGDIRILSRAGVPAELEALSEDRRRLGVMLGGIVVRGTFGVMHLPPEHPALREGFHVAERRGAACVRWTDGHARLPPCPPTPSRLELQVLAVQPAWARAAVPDAPANRIA